MTNKALSGGRFAGPIQVGDTVTRLMGPGATNIHGLLAHLEQQGFAMAPRVLGVTDNTCRRRSVRPEAAGSVRHSWPETSFGLVFR